MGKNEIIIQFYVHHYTDLSESIELFNHSELFTELQKSDEIAGDAFNLNRVKNELLDWFTLSGLCWSFWSIPNPYIQPVTSRYYFSGKLPGLSDLVSCINIMDVGNCCIKVSM